MAHVARRRFGQHFLHDRHVIRRIIAAIDPQPDQTIVEIGPGLGAITAPLLERVQHLTVIEIDRDLVAGLRAGYPPERLTAIESDVLTFDFDSLPASLRVVGNLPYNISTPLLFHLAGFASRIRDAHFMLQREVVDRMVAAADSAAYGRLSVMLQVRFTLTRLFTVAAGSFAPPPKVESAIVRLVPRSDLALSAAQSSALARVVTQAFSQRRKTLRNALAAVVSSAELEALGIDPRLRPEVLDVSQYLALAQHVVQRGAAGG
jgi:16S rRNA (adenine1518-N6/adenine1519-N6)-dimethyltransferase